MVVPAVAAVITAAAALVCLTTASQPFIPGKTCYRKCVPGHTQTCYFHFDVQDYQTLSRACYDCPRNVTDCERPQCVPGDGVRRRILVINKQLPGPTIQVCLGDRVVVDVKNSFEDEVLTIHWHGVTMRGVKSFRGHGTPGTPYMDGVPNLTQCPILPGAYFRYSFRVPDAGTYYYHSHVGLQRGDGVYGAIIVRQPRQDDPNFNTYDYDLPQHIIQVQDWLHVPTLDKFILTEHGGGNESPESMIVNGQGPYQNQNVTAEPALIPYTRFTVTPGNRYRMRVISNAVLSCPITISIEQHKLTLIATDGRPIVPIEVKSFVIYSGERWDFVISAHSSKSGAFWMSFMGGIDCADNRVHQFAVLEYENQVPLLTNTYYTRRKHVDAARLRSNLSPRPEYSEVPPAGRQVNSVNSACYNDRVCVSDLRSPYSMPNDLRSPRADVTIYLAFSVRFINNDHYYSKIYYDINSVAEISVSPTPRS
nr:uncharacterized protein LOC128704618 [Cherax quadricarinatus]